MRNTVDTNVLIRAIVQDDLAQAAIAVQAMKEADEVVITASALCEFVWVLERIYRRRRPEIAEAIRQLIGDEKAVFDEATIRAGLAILEAGGDFADGIIAFEGRRLGGEVFTTFDRGAARLVEAAGGHVNLI